MRASFGWFFGFHNLVWIWWQYSYFGHFDIGYITSNKDFLCYVAKL